jgi:hypothetical protein
MKVALEDQRLNKEMKLLSSVFTIVVGEEKRKYYVVVQMKNWI